MPPCVASSWPLGERQAVHGCLGQVVEDGDPVVRRVVVDGAVGDLDEQSARPLDQQREQVVRRDQVGVDGEPQDAEPVVEVVLPDRCVPLRRRALEHLAAPDVVHQDVETPVLLADTTRASSATCNGSRWSTTSAIPTPPSRVTSSAVSSIVSDRT